MTGKNNKSEKGSDTSKNVDWRAIKKEQKKWKEEKLLKQFKRKREEDVERSSKKPKSEDKMSKGRNYTVSIALPGSILDNAQTLLLKTLLAGQIARAAAIFMVDEIVVFDDTDSLTKKGYDEVLNQKGKCCFQLLTFLQYLECPQYLRKTFFSTQEELRHVGLLNPLVTPHHMRQNDDTPYREGVVIDTPVEKGQGSFVDVGLTENIQVDKQLKSGVRVTVKMEKSGKKVKGKLVSSSEPTKKEGIYWGYKTRLANNLTAVLNEPNTVKDDGSAGYDCVVGTSDKGDSVDNFELPKFKHLIIVFGGLSGLEAALEADQSADELDPRKFFHHYINTCPIQGTRTIRTEEAVPITLCSLRAKIELATNEEQLTHDSNS